MGICLAFRLSLRSRADDAIIDGRFVRPTSKGSWAGSSKVAYAADMCPHTLDLLSRAVHIDISPDLSNEQVAEMTDAVHKVLRLAL